MLTDDTKPTFYAESKEPYGTRMFQTLSEALAWRQVLGEVNFGCDITKKQPQVSGTELVVKPEVISLDELTVAQSKITQQMLDAARKSRAYTHKH